MKRHMNVLDKTKKDEISIKNLKDKLNVYFWLFLGVKIRLTFVITFHQ